MPVTAIGGDARTLERTNELGAVELVVDIEKFLRRFVILPEHTCLPLALWTLATFTFESFDAFPYLAITSPMPRCGKTRLLEVLEQLVANPQRVTNPTEASILRLIEESSPTLIVDEAEMLGVSGTGHLRALFNSGNRRNAVISRCSVDGVRKFNVFCPKVVAAIGKFPATISDRAIGLEMQRRKSGEKVEPFMYRRVEPQGMALRDRAKQFVVRTRMLIEAAYDDMEPGLPARPRGGGVAAAFRFADRRRCKQNRGTDSLRDGPDATQSGKRGDGIAGINFARRPPRSVAGR